MKGAPTARIPRVTVIGDGDRSLPEHAAELWEFRLVLGYLVWRDLKIRYRQTVLGIVWAILQPLMLAAVFGVFFGKFGHLPSDGAPYPLFAFVGLLPWVFVSTTVLDAASSMVTSPDLVTKVFVPRIFIPLASVVAGLVDLAIGAGVLAAILLYYRTGVGLQVFILLPLLLLMMVLATAVGSFAAALNVRYRDVRYALPFLIQVWMFGTPIIYPASMVPERWRVLQMLNPLAGVVEGFRTAVLGGAFDWRAIGVSAVVSAMLLAMSMWYFGRVEQSFADVV